MYLWILGSLLVAVVRAGTAVEATSDRAFSAFLSHLQRYSVTIGDGSEFASRLDVYKKNDEYIALSNARNLTYTLGHNQFSHLTHAEFLETFKLGTSSFPTAGEYGTHRTPKPRAPVHGESSASTVDVPTHVDWAKAGAVTRVKNQGACGSCWAFSATGSLEGAYAIATAQNVTDWPGLSEQELVSCDRENMGCDGGNVGVAYRWVEREAGLCQERDYPYSSLYDIREYPEYPAARSRSVSCNRSCDPLDNTAPVSHFKVEPTELALLSAIGDQPVSVAIDASDRAFQHYSSGIYDNPCGFDLDHAVLATGYGVEATFASVIKS
jgi:C1A family cysteine protease